MKKVQELTDRELQEGIYKYLRDITSSNSTIKTWVVLFAVVSIISAIVVIIPLLD